MRSRVRNGKRCSPTALLANPSARSLPTPLFTVRISPFPRRRLPTSAAVVWAGTHARSTGGMSSRAAKFAAYARAVMCLEIEARSRPVNNKSVADLQSVRKIIDVNDTDTACNMAHVSGPKMVDIQGGGTPNADA